MNTLIASDLPKLDVLELLHWIRDTSRNCTHKSHNAPSVAGCSVRTYSPSLATAEHNTIAPEDTVWAAPQEHESISRVDESSHESTMSHAYEPSLDGSSESHCRLRFDLVVVSGCSIRQLSHGAARLEEVWRGVCRVCGLPCVKVLSHSPSAAVPHVLIDVSCRFSPGAPGLSGFNYAFVHFSWDRECQATAHVLLKHV